MRDDMPQPRKNSEIKSYTDSRMPSARAAWLVLLLALFCILLFYSIYKVL